MSKIKVLWVCNVPIPKIASAIGVKIPNVCGWLTGFADVLENNSQIELHISFPILGAEFMREGMVDNIHYYAFNQPKLYGFIPVEDQMRISPKMEIHIDEILRKVKPDILHSFGTEYPHSTVAIRLFNCPERTIVNIQGLTSYIWMHYNNGIPYNEIKRFAIGNIVRGNMESQARKMKRRGEFEAETLKLAGHIVGRTDWDRACTSQINPNAIYHFCNESLRSSFYSDSWDDKECESHSIFMSQASYPVKGLQFVIRALPEIIRVYPDAHLYVAGNNLIKTDNIYDKLKMSSFAKYIKKLITKEGLYDHITFTGNLSEKQMKEYYLKTNVFVLPSTIENSSNSLGEAMLLGVPCVSSDVGGVKNLLVHEKEGYIYQCDAPYMLAFYVKKVFSDSDVAKEMGRKAQEHAQITHDRERNIKTLLSIYENVSKQSGR